MTKSREALMMGTLNYPFEWISDKKHTLFMLEISARLITSFICSYKSIPPQD